MVRTGRAGALVFLDGVRSEPAAENFFYFQGRRFGGGWFGGSGAEGLRAVRGR